MSTEVDDALRNQICDQGGRIAKYRVDDGGSVRVAGKYRQPARNGGQSPQAVLFVVLLSVVARLVGWNRVRFGSTHWRFHVLNTENPNSSLWV